MREKEVKKVMGERKRSNQVFQLFNFKKTKKLFLKKGKQTGP